MEDPKEKAQEFFNYFFKWEEKKKMKLADNNRIYDSWAFRPISLNTLLY